MTEPTRAVFLSYASQDIEAARRMCEVLRAGGIEVWFDQSELRGGDAWDHHIRRQIADCALFVPIISAYTQARPEGYFRLEWDLADQRSHMMARTKAFIIPVCVDNTPDGAAEVPESFLKVQWTRLLGGQTRPAFVERVASLLAGDPHVPSAATGAPTFSPHRPTRTGRSAARLRPLVLVTLAAALLAAGYFGLDRFVLPKRLSQNNRAPAASVRSDTLAQSKVPEKSIAVLPFIDMSEKHDQEYFSDGLSEELINQLAQNADLLVIARTSSFQFKAKSEDVRSIAASLGVANVLEGSVRNSAGNLRITVQLIRAADGAHVWSKTYDRTLNDVFKIQEQIANTVAQALKATFRGRDSEKTSGTKSIEAYNLYLQALSIYQHLNERSDSETAINYLRQALKADPGYAVAWALLSRSLAMRASFGFDPAHPSNDEARRAAEQALRLDPDLADAHAAVARILMETDWNLPGAAAQLQQALEFDPNNSLALALSAVLAAQRGHLDEALQLINKAVRIDPANPFRYGDLGAILYYAGRYQEALIAIRHVLDLNPKARLAHCMNGSALFSMGNAAGALKEMDRETDAESRMLCMGAFVAVYDALGRKPEADAALASFEKAHATDQAYSIACDYAIRGDVNKAFSWLDRAYRQHDFGMLYIMIDPDLQNVRADPRYKVLLKKMTLSDDASGMNL